MNLDILEKIAKKHNEGLTHFFIKSKIVESLISGNARLAEEVIINEQLIAIIGGLVVDSNDNFIAMPMGSGIFLHQISNNHKGTINHSCDPNCKILGFNKLVAKRQINTGEELTIDYGTISIGNGTVIINQCKCNSLRCRTTIKTDDYKFLSSNDLSLYGKYIKENVI